MKYCILVSVLCSLVFACHGSELGEDSTTTANATSEIVKKPDKNQMVKAIIQKICRIALGPLRDASAAQKHKLFEKLENKVRLASKVLKYDNDNYVNIIMDGIKLMATKGDYTLCAQTVPNMREEVHKTSSMKEALRAGIAHKKPSKVEIIRSMLTKLEVLADKYLKTAKTTEEKNMILHKIKIRVSEALRRRNITDGKDDTYTNIIMDGLKLMMENKDSTARKEALEILADPKALQRAVDDEVASTELPITGFTASVICEVEYKKICSSLGGLAEVVCTYDDTTISLERVCDGHIDCPDGSDEKNCAKQAVVKVHAATEISTLIERARPCFSAVREDNLFAQQSKMLQDLLESQIKFIKKYNEGNLKDESTNLVKLDDHSVAQLSNEVFGVIKTFEIALNGAFCNTPDVVDMDKQLDHRFGKFDEDEDVLESPKWDFRMCACTGKFCTDTKCPMFCKRICYQKYSLKRLSCPSVNNENTVSIDVICDSKYDCHDEADETDCSMGQVSHKFEAQSLYEEIQKMIKEKILTKGFQSSRLKLVNLNKVVQLIAKRSLEKEINIKSFRTLRDRFLSIMVDIYDDALDKIEPIPSPDVVFNFLESIKEKFILGLKKSRTGNKKVLPDDGCFCRGDKCATLYCSPKCARTCAAKPLFTKYVCKSSFGQNITSIPIVAVCNGKPNCPGGEDEQDCKKEICRSHHLVVLRHHLKTVGEKHKGSLLGDVLNVWKNKVLSKIMVVEKNDRPNPSAFKALVYDICQDLVSCYASLEHYRRTSNEAVLLKFQKLAQRIIETAKSCGK